MTWCKNGVNLGCAVPCKQEVIVLNVKGGPELDSVEGPGAAGDVPAHTHNLYLHRRQPTKYSRKSCREDETFSAHKKASFIRAGHCIEFTAYIQFLYMTWCKNGVNLGCAVPCKQEVIVLHRK